MKISLFIENGVAYVWNANDWYTLRTKHRICGTLIGSIASYPRQNDFLGLPMALMSEETALLVDKGICELFSLPNITEKPTEQEKQDVKEVEEIVLEEQKEVLKKKKVEELSQKIDIIVAGKKKKLMSKGIVGIDLDKQTLLQEEINKLPNLAQAYVLVQLPTEHYLDTAKKKCGIDQLKPGVLDRDGATRYSIFRDLWNKGYHITNGTKFGSDYLAYPGDPVRFHAMYMVRCICDQTRRFRPASLVAYGRLSVAVNKLAVLASCNSYGQVAYQTLQWHDSING